MDILHIASASEWDHARQSGVYDRSTRGASIEQVGFLHASSGPEQVAAVLASVYAEETEPLVLLRLDPAVLYRTGLRVVMEPADPQRPDGEWFPHVYGGPIPVDAVAEVSPIDRHLRGGAAGGPDPVGGPDPAGGAREPDAASQEMDAAHLGRAIDVATANAATGGAPFGAVVVTADGQVFQGANQVTATNDPTAHAEVTALREAGAGVGNPDLDGAVLYASCEPCPLCLGAALWSRVSRVVFAADRSDAAAAGFDATEFYAYFDAPEHRDRMPVRHQQAERSAEPFAAWRNKNSPPNGHLTP